MTPLVALRRARATHFAMRAFVLRWSPALLLLGACGTPPQIGAACEADADCGSGQRCLIAIAGGYCTEGCSSDDDCPNRSACAQLTADGAFTCVKLCIDTADCHADRPDDPNLACEPIALTDITFANPDREGRVCLPDPG